LEEEMRTKLLVLVAVVAMMLIMVTPIAAITDGELDNGRHPYVGLMVAQDANGNPLWRCSGTLLSSKIFLTAGHCTEAPAARAEIWFADGPIPVDPNYTSKAAGGTGCDNPLVTGYPCKGDVGGTTYTHPQYNPNAFYLYDLGVVVLSAPKVMSQYGALPQLDQLDRLKTQRGQQDVTFTAVGYGLQASFPDAASWKNVAIRQRMVAYPKLIQINVPGFVGDFSLLLSNNHATGGTCFGDSGGPNFIGNSNVIGGVTSFGKNGNCAGTGGVYRVDRADDLNWLYGTFGAHLP
jgi:hypothetical protein